MLLPHRCTLHLYKSNIYQHMFLTIQEQSLDFCDPLMSEFDPEDSKTTNKLPYTSWLAEISLYLNCKRFQQSYNSLRNQTTRQKVVCSNHLTPYWLFSSLLLEDQYTIAIVKCLSSLYDIVMYERIIKPLCHSHQVFCIHQFSNNPSYSPTHVSRTQC